MRPQIALASLSILAAVLLAPAGAGASVTVGNQNDSGPGSLRQTVADAPPGETVIVPAGTYALTSGEIMLPQSIQIEGAGPSQTVIRTNGTSRIFGVSGGTTAVTISGVTLRDGRVTEPGGIAYGGAIYASGIASLVLRNVVATNNTVDVSGAPNQFGGIGEGGAVAIVSGNLAIFDSKINGNTVNTGGGSGKSGGIAEGGGINVISGGLTIERSDVSGNVALTLGGQGPSSANQNGGIADGGGIAVIGAQSEIRLAATTISSNRADSGGGPGGSNGISDGGGVYLLPSEQKTSLSEVTLAANSASGAGGSGSGINDGGGAYISPGSKGTTELLASTIVGNSAILGGNLYITGSTRASDTIVAAGVGAEAGNCFEPVETSGGFNLDSADECGFHGIGDKVNTDPKLGPLQDNGGPGPTLLPEFGSAAIDQGASFGLSADERGVQRPIDFPMFPNSSAPGADGSDIGAVEVQPTNSFSFGKLSRNSKKGTAVLTVKFPSITFGTLKLSGKGLKSRTAKVSGNGKVNFKIAAKGKVRRQLAKSGKRKVGLKVTFIPGANTAKTKTRKIKLIKKEPNPRR